MARSFNGTSDLVAVDAASVWNMQTACSIAVWLKASGSITNETYYGEGASSTNNQMLQLQCNSGKLRVVMRNSGNAGTPDVNAVASTLTIADNTWHHVILTQDASGNWQTYIDGVADSTAKGSYTVHSFSCNRAGFGCLRRAANANFWAGTLGEGASWSRELSAGEAVALAAGLPASHLAPDHYWPLWGIDSPEPDIGTATRVAGTLTGTSAANGGRVGIYLLRKPAVVLPQAAPSVSKSDSDTASLSEANNPIQIAKADTDDFSTADHTSSLAAAVSGTDTASAASAVTSIALSAADTAASSSSASVDQSGTDKSDTDEGTLSETNSVAATLTDTATASLSETGTVTSTNVAISDSDDFSLDDTVFGTGSGGKADSFYGVVLALADDTFTANPDWVRFDDPVGVS